MTVSNGALTVTSTTHANTGPYQCFANNVRSISSTLWVVTVRDPGKCLFNKRFAFSIVLCGYTIEWYVSYSYTVGVGYLCYYMSPRTITKDILRLL